MTISAKICFLHKDIMETGHTPGGQVMINKNIFLLFCSRSSSVYFNKNEKKSISNAY